MSRATQPEHDENMLSPRPNGRWPLPKSWLWVRANEISRIVGGGTPPSGDKRNFCEPGQGIPWVTPADLTGYEAATISHGSRNLTERGLNNSGAQSLPKGSVLLSSRAPVGYCAIAANSISTNQGFKSFVLKGDISPSYIRYYFKASKDFLHTFASGTTFAEISGKKAGEITIPLPPIAEQRRIVARLEKLEARSRRARAALDAVPELLAHTRQSLLAAAFRGDLTIEWRKKNKSIQTVEKMLAATKIIASKTGRAAGLNVIKGIAALSIGDPETNVPAGGKRVPMTDVARRESGPTPSRGRPEYCGGSVPWIGIQDARRNHGTVIHNTLTFTNQLGLANSAARLLPTGTVCLSRTASVGYVVIMGKEMSTSQDFANWICSPALLPKFLLFAFMAEGDHIRRFGKGTTHTTIYYPELKAMHLCIAPLEEQKEIVRRLESGLAKLDAAGAAHAAALAELDRLDQSLLAQAFRGELVPQNPKDEPAEKLLSRILKAG